MKVINVLGGPGKGKSTLASGLFCKMKMEGYDVELVTEYAKQLVWSKRFDELDNQVYVTAKQFHHQYILEGEVEYMVTDSPIILGAIYEKGSLKYFDPLVLELFNKFDNMNFFITENKGRYSNKGRRQNREESDAVSAKIAHFLEQYRIPHIDVAINMDFDKVINTMFEKIKQEAVK